MVKFYNFFKTIKGRVTALVLSFVFFLLVFSSFVYYQNRRIQDAFEKKMRALSTIEAHEWIDRMVFVTMQYQSLQTIFYNIVPTQQQRKKDREKYLNGVDDLFLTRFKDAGMEEGTEFIRLEKASINEFHDYLGKIYDRMEELKAQGYEGQYINDPVIESIFKNDLKGKAVNGFWGVIQPRFNLTQERLIATRDFISGNLQFTIFSILIAAAITVIFVAFIWYYLTRSVERSIRKPKVLLDDLAVGKLPPPASLTDDELRQVIEVANKLSSSLRDASAFAIEIGKGNYSHQFTPISEHDLLGNALLDMRNNLKEYAEKEKEQNWTNVGLAKFSDILRNNDRDLAEVGIDIVSNLVKYIKANQGGIFLYNEKGKQLELIACYAYERKKYLTKNVQPGEGLIGQCFLEGHKLFLKEVPNNYIKITSGMGEATPNCLLLMPLTNEGKIEGVLEIASFSVLKEYEIAFIEKVCESIAAVVSGVKRNTLTQRLLTETESKSQEMRSAEEELRQNLEELHATQEEMRRREATYLKRISDLEQQLHFSIK